MKILKYLLFLLLITIIGFSVYVTTKPDHYQVERSRFITAPHSMVYNYINDYQKWPVWSPWMEKETGAEIAFSDPSFGKDATYSWKGEEIGEGSMTTLYSAGDSLLQQIEFIKPYQSKAEVYWTLERKKTGVEVSWGMQGDMAFMEKAYMIFQGKDMDNLIGPDYERGLLNLDHVLQEEMARYSIDHSGVTQYGGGFSLYQTTSSTISGAGEQIATLMKEVDSYMDREDINAAGAPFVTIDKWDRENDAALLSVHIPVRDKIKVASGSTVLNGFTEPGPYYKTTLKGDHKNLKEAHEKAQFNIQKEALLIDEEKPPFEVFVIAPNQTDNPAEWITEIYIPLKTPVQ